MGKMSIATASFGLELQPLLQVVKAYSIIVNGGFEINPTLIKKKEKT